MRKPVVVVAVGVFVLAAAFVAMKMRARVEVTRVTGRSLQPGDAPVVELPTSTGESIKLRIVSDAPGHPPIKDAKVAGAGPVPIVTGADGVALIPRGAPAWLRISAPRHVGIRRKVELLEPEQTLVLTRVGSARFTVSDPEGKPVEGLKIRLTPMVMSIGLEVPYPKEQESDKTGNLLWEELLPDTKIDWTCTSGHPIEPGEGVTTGGSTLKQDDEGRWGLVSRGNAFQSGGSFKVAPGEEFRLDLRVQKTGSIHAKIGSGPGASGKVRVQVWSKREVPSPAGTFKDYQAERSLDVQPGAEFDVPNLTSGPKDIRAWWWDEPGRRVFARLSFALEAGEKRDLGTLTPVAGASVEVLVRVEASPEIMDRIVRPAHARITFGASVPANDDLSAAETLEVEVDKPFVLAGLHATRMFLYCDSQVTTKPGASAVRFKGPGQQELALPPPGRIEIVLKGEAEHLVQVNLTFPALAKQNQFDAQWIPTGGGPARRIGGGSPMAGTTSYKIAGYVPPGEGEVWVVSRGELNLYARVPITVRAEGENVLDLGDLRQGAVIRGRIVTKSGKPYKYPISFQLAGVPRGNESIYVAIPDDDGRFVMGAIVPGTRLESNFCKPSIITAGEAGTDAWVDLVTER